MCDLTAFSDTYSSAAISLCGQGRRQEPKHVTVPSPSAASAGGRRRPSCRREAFNDGRNHRRRSASRLVRDCCLPGHHLRRSASSASPRRRSGVESMSRLARVRCGDRTLRMVAGDQRIRGEAKRLPRLELLGFLFDRPSLLLRISARWALCDDLDDRQPVGSASRNASVNAARAGEITARRDATCRARAESGIAPEARFGDHASAAAATLSASPSRPIAASRPAVRSASSARISERQARQSRSSASTSSTKCSTSSQ